MKRGTWVLLAAVAGLVAAPAVAVAEVSGPVLLDNLPGGSMSFAISINNRGMVLGSGDNAARESRGIRWDGEGRPTELPPLPVYRVSSPVAMNEQGVVVGNSYDKQYFKKATRWGLDGVPVELPAPPGYANTEVTAINDSGVAVGRAYNFSGSGKYTAVRWDAAGQVSELARLLSTDRTAAKGIGNDGTIIGGTGARAWRWSADGTVTELERLPGASGGTLERSVNGSGIVAGSSSSAAGVHSAVRWDVEGKATDVGVEPGKSSEVLAINDRGIMAGDVSDAGKDRVVRWDEQGQATRLPTLGGATSRFVALNAEGMIVGEADSADRVNVRVYWDRDGQVFALPPVAAGEPYAVSDINDHGVIVGSAIVPDQYFRAVVWRTR